MNKYFSFFAFSLIAIFLISCDRNRVFEENVRIPDAVWNKDSLAKFELEIKDTTSAHNFYINVRNSGAYKYRNLFLFINTYYPNGKRSRDTIECILADELGKWLGRGSGDIWDNQILFKKGARFPLSGNYKFTFEQAMREDQLNEIMDVGLRIEKQ